MATNDSELTPRDPDWQREHCEAHGMRLLRTEDDTTGGFTVTVTLSNELRLENQTKNKNNTLISNAPKYLADPEWRQYSQAAIAAEKRYIKKTTISAITKERDEKIKKLEAVMEEKIKALGGSALDRASAGGVLATEMTLQAAAITKTFAAKLAAREIVDRQMAEECTLIMRRDI